VWEWRARWQAQQRFMRQMCAGGVHIRTTMAATLLVTPIATAAANYIGYPVHDGF